MEYKYRKGSINDVEQLKALGKKSWSVFKDALTTDAWEQLYSNISNINTYLTLLETADCFVCLGEENKIIGMAFLVPSGNATDIYEAGWCSIRFVSVDPDFNGKGIGKALTLECIRQAQNNQENIIALHTSELMQNARHIYEQLGFTILKEIPPRFNKRYWVYTLNLKPEVI